VEITLIQLAQLTQEDDSVGSGLCPEKILKPLFKPAATQTAVAVNAQSSQTVVQKVSTDVTTPSESVKEPVACNANDPSIGRKLPKIKMGQFGPSIRKKELEKATASPSVNAASLTLDVKEEDRPIYENDLLFYWHEFANLLPKEETAMAQRMRIMEPKLIEEHTFEVLVENNQVNEYLQKMVPRITAHMKKGLHNSKLTMTIRTAAPNEVTRFYSKPEQFQAMMKKNKAFAKLQHIFGLELV
jgi:DNA polymerase-3 subunit gamma/tau